MDRSSSEEAGHRDDGDAGPCAGEDVGVDEVSPFAAGLGVQVASVSPARVELHLPYRPANSNATGILHGGVAASLVNVAARIAAVGVESSPDVRILDQDVQFLATAREEALDTVATVLKRGRELVFVRIDVTRADGTVVATGTVTARTTPPEAREDDGDPVLVDPPPRPDLAEVPGGHVAGPVAEILEKQSFSGALGVKIRHMADGMACLWFPHGAAVDDGEGNHHDGALAALLDTAGAMASWSTVELGMHRAATTGIHLRYLAPTAGEATWARATVRWQRDETFVCELDCAGAGSGRVFATGSLLYRIVLT